MTTCMTGGPSRMDYFKHLMSWWTPRLPVPGAIAEQIDIHWVKHITPETGQADFAAMADELYQHVSA